MRSFAIPVIFLLAASWNELWLTADQQGQQLMDAQEFEQAAETFTDPMRQGVAWFRAKEFEKAEGIFAGVGTAESEFNRGNCLVMQGKYKQAIEHFDQALNTRPDWEDASFNRSLAIARMKLTERSGGRAGDQRIGADEVVFDRNKESGGQNTRISGDDPSSESAMQAMWLRRLQTTPADFLKAKFAYQLQVRTEQGDQ